MKMCDEPIDAAKALADLVDHAWALSADVGNFFSPLNRPRPDDTIAQAIRAAGSEIATAVTEGVGLLAETQRDLARAIREGHQ